MTHLSLCSGIGGLDLAIGTPTTFAEIDPAPAEVLAEWFPEVPNLGDWTQLDTFNDWPHLITGGLPCQPVSAAGKGRGDTDERYLFDDFIRILRSSDVRPTLVLENVRGILYPRNGVAFWRLISALADLGYVGRWEIVRASDVGAPHRRERWFCVARHADSMAGETSFAVGGGFLERQFGQRQGTGAGSRMLASHPDGDAITIEHGDTTQAITERDGRGNAERRSLEALRESKYGTAVRRWEALTRPCPAPLDDGDRLSVAFVEWMMGYPDGWTAPLSRAKALKALGNAVVPQQARLAVQILNEPLPASPQTLLDNESETA